jgi:hypothetical protein
MTWKIGLSDLSKRWKKDGDWWVDNEMDHTSLPVLVLFGMRPQPVGSNHMTYDSEDTAEVPEMT